MARYDVYVAPDGSGLLLDVQTDLLDGFDTRLVAPLIKASAALQRIKRLHPVFEIGGESYVMATQLLVAAPQSVLGEAKANLADRHDEIIAALDMIIHGF